MRFEELPERLEKLGRVNLSGQECNGLKILYRVKNTKSKHGMWATYCPICDEYDIKRTDGLVSGRSTCVNRLYHNRNLIGQKYGMLLPIKMVSDEHWNGYGKYECLCDCGNTYECYGYDLVQGNHTNCGCKVGYKDIVGQKFGAVTVLEATNKRKSGSVVWKCECDCGNTCFIPTHILKSGKGVSCGCLKSYGEYVIKKILNKNKIKYKYNKTFSNCKFPDTNYRALFDFYIEDDKTYLVEFDGTQHTDENAIFFNDVNNYVIVRNHDLFKNQWAWDNNIPMKRIPYNHRNKLDLESIVSDKFLITPETHPEWYPSPDSSYPYFNINKTKEVS